MEEALQPWLFLIGLAVAYAARRGYSKMWDGQEKPTEWLPQVDLGWMTAWDGEPMDWIGVLGAGALLAGIAIAIICDLVIVFLSPRSPSVTDIIRETTANHPVLTLIIGLVCGHLFWGTITPKKQG